MEITELREKFKKYKYSKHFKHDGILIIFDKLESSEEYPSQYIVKRNANVKSNVFIDKKPIQVINVIKTDNIKIVTFGFK